MAKSNPRITMYTSSFCSHSWSVERFLEDYEIPVRLINIDRNPKARKKLIALNNGYASVPTLIFPDGMQLTEPSFSQLRDKLGIESPSLFDKIRGLFGRTEE
ncbi:MAG: glutaredoxin family protein [Anaerolineae bacterium]